MSQPNEKTPGSKSVFIVAGEASGDLHASHLVKELSKLDSSIKIEGMGGSRMKAAGVELFIDSTDLAVVGLFEVLANYGKIKRALDAIKKRITESQPDLLVLVDYQEFNQKLAAYAKSIGIKVLFYIGPQVWAWRPGRVHKIAKIVDHMAVIFPFEVAAYSEAGVDVTFTGHPLVDEVIPDKTPEEARKQLDIEEKTTIGLFPGSRVSEINRVLPVMLKAAKKISSKKPELQFILPIASTLSIESFDRFHEEIERQGIRLISDKSYDVMQACDAIMTASGTATLEIGLMERPMAIVYKISPLSYAILNRMVNLDHIGLVNIVAGKEIIQEFIQGDAKPDRIADEIIRILDDTSYNQSMKDELAKLRQLLGTQGGSENVAKLVIEMLR